MLEIFTYCQYNVERQILMFHQVGQPGKIFLIQQTIPPMLEDRFEIPSNKQINKQNY